VKQGEKLSRVPLHLVRTPNLHTELRKGSISLNFDFYIGEATEGEILMLILGGLHEACSATWNLGTNSAFALRTEKTHGKP
jgi:hypothetical protein